MDIKFSIEREIILQSVTLCQPQGSGLDHCNVASVRVGEAWRALGRICSDSQLEAAVRGDLANERSRLRNLILKVWRNHHRAIFSQALADCLNSVVSPEFIEQLILVFGQGIPVIFLYTKEDGIAESRRVFVLGTAGRCLRGVDQKDDKKKSFRMDRISSAEAEILLNKPSEIDRDCRLQFLLRAIARRRKVALGRF